MIHADDVYLFRHGLLRDAAYNLQLPGERARLHFSAMDILEAEPEAESALAADMADHAREAATLPGSESEAGRRELHYLRLAVAHAGRVYESGRQVELCRRVADHPLCEPATAAAELATAARALINLGRALEAEPLVGRAIDMSMQGSDRLQQLSIRRLQMEVFKLTGRRALAYAEMPGLVAELREFGDSAALANAELDLEDVLLHAGDHAGGLECIQRSWDIAKRLGDERLEAHALARLGYRLHKDRRSEEGERAVLQGLELSRASGDPFAEASLANALGVIYVETHRVELARQCYTRAMELATLTGRFHAKAVMARNLANIEYYFGGDLQVAARMYRQAREFFAEGGDLENASMAAQSLGSALSALGDPAAALHYFEDSIGLARTAGSQQREAIGRRHAALARRALDPARTDVPELVTIAQMCVKLRDPLNLEHTLNDLAQDLFDLGLLAAARRLLNLAMKLRGDVASGWSTPPLQAQVELLMGDTSRVDILIDGQASIFATADTPHHHISRVLHSRLRIAVAAAAGVAGTAHLSGDWPGMDAATEIYNHVQQLAQGGPAQYTAVLRSMEAATSTITELRAAIQQQRPAQLFRGHPPDQLKSACRAALLAHLQAVTPDAYAHIQNANPKLFVAMQGGAPDWTVDDLPDGTLKRLESELASWTAQP